MEYLEVSSFDLFEQYSMTAKSNNKGNTTNLKSFNYLESGEVTFSILDTIKTTKKLDSGIYKLDTVVENNISVTKLTLVQSEEIVELFNFTEKDKIDELSTSFFDEKVKNKIQKLGLLHKYAILFYGKEGTGKSSIKKYYYNRFVSEQNSLVFQVICASSRMKICWDFIKSIRTIQNNPIIIVLEEFDQFVRTNDNGDAYMKTILDGNNSIDNCIFLASTNYLEQIPEAIKNRPSRFKYVIEITEIEDFEIVKKIINNMVGEMFSEDEIDSFSKEMTGQTVDFIKQFCLDKIMNIKNYKSKKGIGFSRK